MLQNICRYFRPDVRTEPSEAAWSAWDREMAEAGKIQSGGVRHATWNYLWARGPEESAR